MAKLEQELNQLALEIEGGLDSFMQSESEKRGPSDHSKWNWASEAHHPCSRFLCYARLNWKDRKPKPTDSLYRLREGVEQEDKIIDLMAKAGYRLKLGQLPLEWDKYKIHGKIDGAISQNRKEYPAEVKSLSPWFWQSTRTLKDIKDHNKFWIQRIPSQLNLYLLMKNEPGGFLILVTFGARPRIMPMMLDYDLGEKDLQQIETVNALVEKGEYAPRVPYKNDICELCDFDHICQPIKFAEIVEATADQVKDLHRYLEIAPTVAEHRKLKEKLIGDKSKPGSFWGKNCIIEDIEVTTTEYDKTYYDVPAEEKIKYKKMRKATRTKIGRIG